METERNPEMISTAKEDAGYEKLQEELSEVVKKLESSDITLEDQILYYEKGMKLIGRLSAILKNAEERITVINRKGEEERFE